MEITERKGKHLERRRIKKIFEDPSDGSIVADIIREEALEQLDVDLNAEPIRGTSLNQETLKNINWRDDKSLSYASLSGNELPLSVASLTQIVTKQNGEVWIIPPFGSAFQLPGTGGGISSIPNASKSVVGGITMDIRNNTLYIRNDGVQA